MTEFTELILLGASTAVSVGATLFSGIKYLSLKKKLKKIESYDSIYNVIFDAVSVAETKYKPLEKMGIDCAEMKRTDVLDTAQKACLANGWDYDEDECTAVLEQIIQLTKEVNYKGGK